MLPPEPGAGHGANANSSHFSLAQSRGRLQLAHYKSRRVVWVILSQELQPGLLETFRDELHKLGYVEGKDVSIELRNAAGHNERLPALVEELLQLKVEVIVAVNTPAAQAAKKATKTIPIVIMRVGKSRQTGLVASLLARPGNVYGFEFYAGRTRAKGGAMLHEILPKIHAYGRALPRK